MALAMQSGAHAQQFRPKPVRIVLRSPPAAQLTLSGASFRRVFTKALGQPVIVENRPGAGGLIGVSTTLPSPCPMVTRW
jgi:tripartite-type tricarboxylate transporter receptor subunit TctC